MSARLMIKVSGLDQKVLRRTFEEGREVWLGRDESCDLVLPSPSVSRRHASVRLEGDRIIVRDTSSNGTRVGSQRALGCELPLQADRVVLHVGPCRVKARRHLPAPPAQEPPDQAPSARIPSSPSESPPRVAPLLRRQLHTALLDRIDLTRLKIGAAPDDALRANVRVAAEEVVAAHLNELPLGVDRLGLVVDLLDEALGLGPLERLLADASVSEIMVVDAQTIFAEKNGKLDLTGLAFTDDEAVRAAIERIVTPLGRRIDESNPLVDARLRDGSRVNAIIPPLATKGPCITIRKFPAKRPTIDTLLEYGSLDDKMARFLTRSVAVKKNIVISGGTGSGKTTLLNVLSSAIPGAERIVTIEDAAELELGQPHVVSLESRPPNLEGQGEFSIRDLVKNALRMRPDRIVVGECRGGEALDMLQAMNTGHEGSMTTTHANTPREAVGRIETLCLMAGVDLPLSAIRRQIASSIHLIVQQARLSDGSRKITSITEVLGVDDHGEVELAEIFGFQAVTPGERGEVRGRFVSRGHVPTFVHQWIERGVLAPGELL